MSRFESASGAASLSRVAGSPGGRLLSGPVVDAGWVALAAAAAAVAAVALCAATYLFGLLVLPAVLAAAAFLVAALYRPAWGLAGAALLAPLELVELPIGAGAVSPAEAALAVVALAWLARVITRSEEVVLPSLRDLPILLLLVTFAAGLLFADEVEPVLRVLVFWFLFACVYFQAQSLTEREMALALKALVVAGGVLGAIGALAFIASGETSLIEGGSVTGERATATFADANYYACFLVLAAVPGAVLMLSDFRRNAWLLAPVAGVVAGVLFSLSRGGILGLAVGVLVLLLWGRARKVLVVALPVAGVALALGLTPGANQQIATVGERLGTLDSTIAEEDTRPRIWRTALNVTAENPVFGVGVKRFGDAAGERGLFERGSPVENVHNQALNFAAENGLVGLVAFLVLMVQLTLRGVGALKGADPLRYALALGLLAAFAGFVVQSLTQSQLRVNLIAGTFFLLAGMMTALADRARAESYRGGPARA